MTTLALEELTNDVLLDSDNHEELANELSDSFNDIIKEIELAFNGKEMQNGIKLCVWKPKPRIYCIDAVWGPCSQHLYPKQYRSCCRRCYTKR